MSKYSEQQWANLVQQTKATLPGELGDQAWYLLISAALSTSPTPELLAEFYTYITEHEASIKSEDAIEKLSLHLRDVLLKQIILIGAPQVLMALTPLSAAQGFAEEKSRSSKPSEKWKDWQPADIHARGTNAIQSIYGRDLLHNRIFTQWGDNSADVQYHMLFTVYGLYLSDFEHLAPLETELVVFSTISCLGLGTGPALWHLRGLGRLLGARGDDESEETVRKVKDLLRSVKVALMTIVEFVGDDYTRRANLESWPNVGDVNRVLGGWGENA